MKLKLVRESLNDIFKPKSEEDIKNSLKLIYDKLNKPMHDLFFDLHKKGDIGYYKYTYYNDDGKWVLFIDDESECIDASANIFRKAFKDFNLSDNIIEKFIENWLNENTNWSKYKVILQ